MSRLRHSPEGFVLQMQMSRYQFWLFVEGIDDRPFYSNICRHAPALSSSLYVISLAQEAPQFDGNGKPSLLRLHEMLRDGKGLVTSLGKKKTSAIFFLDKDVDDLLGRCEASPHIVYTQHYTAENYLFLYGDLCAAVETAACVDYHLARHQIASRGNQWTQSAAENWKEWAAFCLFAAAERLSGERGYGVTSRFNKPYEPTNLSALEATLSDVQHRATLPAMELMRRYEDAKATVDRLYEDGKADSVFNGKWYVHFLAADAAQAAAGSAFKRKDLNKRLLLSLLASLDFSAEWVRYFHERINQVASLLR